MISLIEFLTESSRAAFISQVALSFTAIAALGWLVQLPFRDNRLRPFVGVDHENGYKQAQQRYATQCGSFLLEGIRKFGETSVFWVPALPGPTMVIPHKYVPEVKVHPDLSFVDYLRVAFHGETTGLDKPFRSASFLKIIKKHVTQSLGHITSALSEEAVLSLQDSIPLTNEWSTQTLHPTLASVVARVSTRVFLGGEICHDQEWLGIVKQFLKNNLECAYALRRWPAFMAPVVKHFIGAYSATQKAYAESNVYIGKILKARYASMAEQGEDYIKPNDALQWAMDMGEPDEKLADFQLFLSAFAVHTTSSALTQMIFDLCQHPEFIEPLREEIRDVVGDEIFETKSQVQRLRKLDSFMKESQRMNPIQHISLQRLATKDIELSDGFKIRNGDLVGVASTPYLRDSRLYDTPDVFDAFRFHKLRQQPGKENSYQYVTTTDDFLGFGQGTHACPGRFFASNEIKIVLIYLLQMYEFRFPDGQTKRPENIYNEGSISPNTMQKVLFRQRG